MKTQPNDPINPSEQAIVGLDKQVQNVYPNTTTSQFNCGLTKREYFAAMAMQGLLVNYESNGQYGNHSDFPMVEGIAVRCADQLIEELNK